MQLNMEPQKVGIVNKIDETVTWTIEKFSTYQNCRLLSPEFNSNFIVPVRWFIYLYPTGRKKADENYISIYVERLTQVNDNFFIRISILDDQMERMMSHDMYIIAEISCLGYPKFADRSYILDKSNFFLNNDNLLIQCVISKSKIESVSDYSKTEIENAMSRLKEFDNYETLLCNDLFADVTLTVDEEKISAHKSILANRSSVFRTMLEKHREEKITNIVINDMKYIVLKELLRFIYAGKVNDIAEIAFDLLDSANKYEVKGVTYLCEKSIRKTLNNENSIEYLRLSNMYASEELKDHVIDYIVENSKDIVDLPGFKLTATLDSTLLSDLLRAIIKK